MFATGLAFAVVACSQEDAPAEKVAEVAEEIVAPAAEPTPLAKGKWAPQDDCSDVEGAGTFRQILSAAVKARDVDVLVAIAADDVKLDFGGGAGKAELRRRLGDPSLGLWGELDALMALGCAANEQGGITIPWFFEQEVPGDEFDTFVVTGENVPMRSGPAADAPIVAHVSWDAVVQLRNQADREFRQVRWTGPEEGEPVEGYIAANSLRSMIDYRLVASSRNGRWRITSFVAGD